MKGYTKLPKKQLYFILVSCAVIIFAASLETMMRVKDLTLFNQWYSDISMYYEELQYTQDQMFNAYVTANLSYFFLTIIVPVIYGIHAYYAYIKLRISGIFIFLWVILSVGALAYTVIEYNFNSLFYYVRIISYLVLIITTLSLTSAVNESKLL